MIIQNDSSLRSPRSFRQGTQETGLVVLHMGIVTILLLLNCRAAKAAGNPPTPGVWYTASGEERTYDDLRKLIASKGSLAGTRLIDVSLDGAPLAGLDLSSANLAHASLVSANLRGARLSGAILSNADLSGANLENVDLTNADLSSAQLRGANMKGAVLHSAALFGANLELARAEDVDFSSSVGLGFAYWGFGLYWNQGTKWPSVDFYKPRNLNSLEGKLSLLLNSEITFWVGVIVLAMLVTFMALGKLQELITLRGQQTKIKELERAPKADLGLLTFIEQQLNLTIERERLTMLAAHTRAQRLASVGTIVLLLSLLAPLISTLTYVNTVPTADEIRTAQAVTKDAKMTPDQLSKVLGPDWRVLLSGLSFGLLLLAAARGIMKQEQQQREMYFRVAQRVTSFENMVSALRISDRLEKEGQSWQLPSTLELIVARLLNPDPLVYHSAQEKEESQDLISTTFEALKSLK